MPQYTQSEAQQWVLDRLQRIDTLEAEVKGLRAQPEADRFTNAYMQGRKMARTRGMMSKSWKISARRSIVNHMDAIHVPGAPRRSTPWAASSAMALSTSTG